MYFFLIIHFLIIFILPVFFCFWKYYSLTSDKNCVCVYIVIWSFFQESGEFLLCINLKFIWYIIRNTFLEMGFQYSNNQMEDLIWFQALWIK